MRGRSVIAFAFVALFASGEWGGAMKAERPSVLLNAEELARLREELKTVVWKRALYEEDKGARAFMGGGGVKPNADRWLAAEVEIPARSGHFHNFFCDDGTRLELPRDLKPSPDGYRCPACGRVYKGEKFDAAVRWRLHNELAVAALDLALVYAVESDERYAAKAAEILTKYADAYPGPHTTYVEGGIMYQSLCEAVWSIPLACAYDLIFDSGVLSAEDKIKVEARLFKPIAQGLMKVGTHGNWGSWHLSAVGVIGYAIRDRELTDYAIRGFKSQIANQLGDDGLWPESVHTYHFYPLNAFLYLAEAALHDGTDLYHWEAKPGRGLESMFIAPLSYMYPNFQLAAINDGWFDSHLPLHQYELAYARYGDPVLGWALKEGYKQRKADREGLWALLHGRPLDGDLPAPELRSVNFPVLGIIVLRSPGGNVMTFDYGPFLGHGQPDKMGITLFANHRLLAADYGTCGYGSSALRWYTSTPAHNTVVVDGRSQAGTKERNLTCFDGGPVFEAAEAETLEAYPGVLHKRSVLRAGENFVVIDNLNSQDEHVYDWFLHCEGNLRVDLAERAKPVTPLSYEYVEEKEQYAVDGAWNARWESEDQGLSLFMLDAGQSLVTAADCPAETTVRKVPLLIVRRSGKQAAFTCVLVPYRKGSEIRCSLSDGLIKIEHDGMVDWVYAGRSGKGSPLRTDGRFALVRTNGCTPILASVIDGKRVVWKGRVLLRSSDDETSCERASE